VRELASRQAEGASAARRIVETLVNLQVDTFFGIPGGPVAGIFDAIFVTPGARLIESRQETAAAFSAIGYYRATGRVPVVVVTAGPGATNVMTGLVSAHLERVPMLVLCGDISSATNGEKLLQDTGPEGIGIEGMVRRVTRASATVASARSAASQVLAMLHAATEARSPGPALLVVPVDRARTEAPTVRFEGSRPGAAGAPDAAAVREVSEWLAASRQPLVVLGAACRPHAELLESLVDALDVPFLTTPQAKGVVSEDHPHSLRNGGLAASWWARRYTAAGVDVALVLGTDLDDCAVGTTPPIAPNGRLIHVDIDSSVFCRNYPTAMGIISDLERFAAALRDEVNRSGVRNPFGPALSTRARSQSPVEEPDFAADDSRPLTPHRAIADLERAAGKDALFVTDIGEHMLFALHYLTARGPDRFVIHLGLGSMGSGICSAIGLALGDRSRPVVCICGDGGMAMTGGEILVAVKYKLPIVYAVFNDARYNMVYHGQRDLYGRGGEYDTEFVDFAFWAASLGASGARVHAPGEITSELLASLTASGRPVVLDIRHDRAVRVRGAGRIEALRRMSVSGERPSPSGAG
jgi:acetolactate synthase-1/2/3 large subunit